MPFLLSSAYDQATLDQHPAFDGVANIGKPAPRERLLSTLASLLAT
ncbi:MULTISPECIES: hypothetical protein [unclassified Bosea (in: a-proteobacteria)]|nr:MULTISPECIES: hypothetical protein [unclassified Bosea (in: a-proteobacteria)]